MSLFTSVDSKNLKLLASGVNSSVYLVDGNHYVLKKYKTNIVANKEIDILEFLSMHNAQHSLIPVYINREKKAIVMKKLSTLNLLPFNVLTLENKFSIVKNIIKGIEELHRLGIIHNDLKLDNILYDPVTLSVKLIDFSSSFFSHCTPINNATTPIYNSPDQIKNQQSDIWSVGILILKLCEIEDAQIISIINGERPIFPKIDQSLLYIAYKCLNVESALRPSITEIINMFGN